MPDSPGSGDYSAKMCTLRGRGSPVYRTFGIEQGPSEAEISCFLRRFQGLFDYLPFFSLTAQPEGPIILGSSAESRSRRATEKKIKKFRFLD